MYFLWYPKNLSENSELKKKVRGSLGQLKTALRLREKNEQKSQLRWIKQSNSLSSCKPKSIWCKIREINFKQNASW